MFGHVKNANYRSFIWDTFRHNVKYFCRACDIWYSPAGRLRVPGGRTLRFILFMDFVRVRVRFIQYHVPLRLGPADGAPRGLIQAPQEALGNQLKKVPPAM